MNRKPLVWMLAPLLLAALYGCPTKKPQTAEQTVERQTETVTPPPPTAVAPPPTAQAEDPLLSSDMQAVNDELRRRGFSQNVYFAFDESTLSAEAREQLARNADLLRDSPQLNLLIEGHADERGTNEYNLALGERRAYAARDYLASLGVSDDRLRALSYGEERPACTESEESCWSQNRRAYMVLTRPF
ncbi:MAG TPA: peptidoglycan-associated lipoprotein Pal [Thermoanaerobaculia bacterium]|nr:peptidoglycan-associated lipoprotein Pal [Thermoanaerobaculia bacterium]